MAHRVMSKPPFDRFDLLSLAQAGVPPFTKTWRGAGVYEGEDDITFDWEWSPTSVAFHRVGPDGLRLDGTTC